MIPVDQDGALAGIEYDLELYRSRIRNDKECGVNSTGVVHKDILQCENDRFDEVEGQYCSLERIYKLKARREEVKVLCIIDRHRLDKRETDASYEGS